MDNYGLFIIPLVIIAGIFLLFREGILIYFRINDRVKQLDKIIDLLEEIRDQNVTKKM